MCRGARCSLGYIHYGCGLGVSQLSPSSGLDDKVPPITAEQTGTTKDAAVKVRASEFGGLTGRLNPEEKVVAFVLAAVALFVVVSFIWRLLN